MSRAAVLVLLAACGGKKEPPAPAPASGSAPPVAIVVDAAAPDAMAPCNLTGFVSDILDGPSVRFCTKDKGADNNTRRCVGIDSKGVATMLPDDTWPPAPAPGDLEVIAPPGWTAKTVIEDQRVVAVELCKDATCSRVPLAPTKDHDLDEAVTTVAILPDAKTVAIDRGMFSMSHSRLELHTITPPKLVTVLALPKNDCTNIEGFAGDLLVLQGLANCVDNGGSRALATADGKIKKIFDGMFAPGQDYKHVGGTKWAFAMSEDGVVEVWDVATMKRVAKTAAIYVRFGVTDDHVLVALDNDGTVTRYDADLKSLGTTTLPPCAK